MRPALIAVLIVFLGFALFASPARSSTAVRVTYYLPTGSVMRSGIYPFAGAASCSPDLSDVAGGVYRAFWLDGRRYQCLDTGGGVLWRHVDLFAWTLDDAYAMRAYHGDAGEIVFEEEAER